MTLGHGVRFSALFTGLRIESAQQVMVNGYLSFRLFHIVFLANGD